MAGTKLTDTKLRALLAKGGNGKTQKIPDGNGLYVYVTPAGKLLWRILYRFPDAEGILRQRLYAIDGGYPAVSLAAARDVLKWAKALKAEGKDPNQAKKEAKQVKIAEGRTFRSVAEEWDQKRNANLSSAVYHGQILAALERDVYPAIGDMPVADVTPQTIRELLQTIEARGVTNTPHKVCQIIKRIFTFAQANEYVVTNPAEAVSATLKVQPPAKHRRGEKDPAKLGALLRAIDGYTGDFPVRCALRLIPLLACRSRELREAEWTEIDWSNALWNIPAERMKMRQAHTIPLSSQALAIFEDAKRYSTNPQYVFPTLVKKRKRDPKPVITPEALQKALHKCEGGEELDIHGFRNVFRTLCREQLRAMPEALEEALAHGKPDSLGDTYNQTKWLEERRVIMQAWSDYLDDLKTGVDPVEAAEKHRCDGK